MKRVYLDNGSTSFPKAPGVTDAMKNFMDQVGTNINRGGYEGAYEAEDVIFSVRQKLCKIFNFHKNKNVIFTPNITYSLNFIIKGYLKSGDHVLVSSMEHNAMMRPLTQMTNHGVTFDRMPCNKDGELILEEVEPLIKPNTKAIMMLHASNVCGTIMPLEKVGEICKKHNIKFIVDAAQTAGCYPIDMKAMNIDCLAFTGHKSLLGPQGIGGFLVSDEIADNIEPLISGGTGSASDTEIQPNFLPDKFESGTMNIPAIYGLNAALIYLENKCINNILDHELALTKIFLQAVAKMKDVRIVGEQGLENRAPVVSLNFIGRDNAQISFLLDNQYGISTRCGMHCAPNAHKTLGTFPQGTVRFAFGNKNTDEEVQYAIESISKILKKIPTDSQS